MNNPVEASSAQVSDRTSNGRIPFNKPYFTGGEVEYIRQAFEANHTAGNGAFTRRCQEFFERRYGFHKCLLTQSCTDALEMCALLARIRPGDEVIVPSYTFVSTANAFVLQGARIRFCDSEPGSPHLDPSALESLIGPSTRAIVVVHYGGVAANMRPIVELARKHGLVLIEDAAQAIESSFDGRPLGGIGDLATFSFHETKNIICGEGGMLVINNPEYAARAEILWEKGTNRSAFFRGEVDKYRWVDVGSSFLPSELTAAALWAQLEQLEPIQARRVAAWSAYHEILEPASKRFGFDVPSIRTGATANGHLYYLVCRSCEERTVLIQDLDRQGINAVFHYQALHQSPYQARFHEEMPLPHAERYSDCLLRLPLFAELEEDRARVVARAVLDFYERRA
jgi:TDP-4-keto-6-deoxy-D-glucose transaminase